MPTPYKPIYSNNLLKIQNWAREYQRSGCMPQPVAIRFGIGLYQVGQAKRWEGGPAAWQGFAAASLHWLMVSEHFDLGLECELDLGLTDGWPDLRKFGGHYCGDTPFLMLLARAQQQIIYGIHSAGSNRKSRFDKGKLRASLGGLVRNMLCMIPPSYRATAFHDEMQILVGDIVTPGKP